MSDKTRRMLRVVFATSECAPFCKTGGLGDVAGTYPQELAKSGCKVVVMLPKYGSIPQQYVDQMEHVTNFYVPLAWRNVYCGLERIKMNGVEYYFVDNEDYFKRDSLYGYFDDGERFAFFSKAITESLQYLPDFECDILHCNDWQTALAPVFLREFYQGIPLYENVRTIFTVHNVEFQGQYSDFVLGDICGLAHIPNAVRALYVDNEPKTVNYMKGALIYSDLLTTVSPTYAEELKTPYFGYHMDPIFRERAGALSGVLNGIDMVANDPATDPAIVKNFTSQDLSGKAACKAALQEELGLYVDPDRPLVAMVTRLTPQKGMDLVLYGLEYLIQQSVQIAILGTGDKPYEDALRYFDWKYPNAMAACITFDIALSKRFYSGADMFLMPSVFEPCGISQMISMRYGTLPIVRETGGLKDTVTPYNQFTGEGTGFSFANINGDEMVNCIMNACDVFWNRKDSWYLMQTQAMAKDFSWALTVDHYRELYHRLHPEVTPYVVKREEPVVVEVPKVEEKAPEPEKEAAATEAAKDEKPAEKPAKAEKTAEKAPEAEKPAPRKEASKDEAELKKPVADKKETPAKPAEPAKKEAPKAEKAPAKKEAPAKAEEKKEPAKAPAAAKAPDAAKAPAPAKAPETKKEAPKAEKDSAKKEAAAAEKAPKAEEKKEAPKAAKPEAKAEASSAVKKKEPAKSSTTSAKSRTTKTKTITRKKR